MENTVIKAENVSKKYCRSLKHVMLYGVHDIARNTLGLSSQSERLRDGEFWAVDDVSFEVKRGETLGIIGPNGSGKSTMLKLINGIFMPDKGRIEIKGRVGALIEVGAGFHPMLNGRENIYVNGAILGMSKKEIDKKFDEIVDFADIGEFIDAPVKHYSSGMVVRLGFAIAVHCEPDILLVDEVLAVGDVGFQNKCFNKVGELRKKGVTTILVSHNMHIISAFTINALVLNNSRATYFDSVVDAIKEYTNIFIDKQDSDIEKVCNGTDGIKFFDVAIDRRIFKPGESFVFSAKYEASVDYSDTEIDVGIYCGGDSSLYFQANNKAYNQRIDIKKGIHSLKITIKDIRINNAVAKIGIAIWAKDRTNLLFWWRIPVEFKGVDHSTGRNFLNLLYEIGD
ncbi:teichoic acids export ATP-binding protein TagH [bacterium BMS3Bbin08]|nr:teichoic acids export ATP-binding protein TagH [bacterium BMS3Bbin08]